MRSRVSEDTNMCKEAQRDANTCENMERRRGAKTWWEDVAPRRATTWGDEVERKCVKLSNVVRSRAKTCDDVQRDGAETFEHVS